MIKKIVLMISMISVVTCTPAYPAQQVVIDKTSVVCAFITGSILTACAPTVYTTAKSILHDAWQKTKQAAATCAYYAARVGIAVAAGIGIYKSIWGTTTAERAGGVGLLVAAGAATTWLAYNSRPAAPAPAPAPQAPGGPGQGQHGHVIIAPINFA